MKLIKFNDNEFECLNAVGTTAVMQGEQRESVLLTVVGAYDAISTHFVDNNPFTIVDDFDGEQTVYDYFDYKISGDIIDHRDGTVSVYMCKKTRLEIELEKMEELPTHVTSAVSKLIMNSTNEDIGNIAASVLSEFSDFLNVTNWQVGMTTATGEIVRYGNYNYVYTGKETMIHTNPLFYPSATGVHYWSIIPQIYQEHKVYPNIDGISVSVVQDELWWNTTKDVLYKWNAVDNSHCVWTAGAQGVYQWVKAE